MVKMYIVYSCRISYSDNIFSSCFWYFLVNRSLPIRITMEDVQNNVQFIKLLTTLTQHINEDGMCQAVSSDLKEVLFVNHNGILLIHLVCQYYIISLWIICDFVVFLSFIKQPFYYQAEEHIKHEKMRWLQQMTLHTELKELLLDQQIKFSESNTQLSSHQVITQLTHMMSYGVFTLIVTDTQTLRWNGYKNQWESVSFCLCALWTPFVDYLRYQYRAV